MPNSRPPRKPYRGSRSGRDLASGKLRVESSAPTGSSATEHRSADTSTGPDFSGGSHEPGPVQSAPPSRSVPAGPGHLRPSNRRAILVAAGAGLAAGAGGLVYDRKRRRAGVSKLYNPYTDETVDVSKGLGQHRGKIGLAAGLATAGGFDRASGGHNQRVGNRRYMGSPEGRRTVANFYHSDERGDSAGSARAGRKWDRGAADQARNYAVERSNKRHRVGKAHGYPASGSVSSVRGARRSGYPVMVQVGNSNSVSPLLPRGAHVSHENDLSVTTRRGQRKGSPSALARYSSGSQTQMTGGGQAYGHRASHVKKSLDTQQYAATRGSRGTPLSGIAQAGRVGHRLTVY